MTILTKLKPSEFKLLDAGTHLAVCDAVVAVGLQETKYGNKDTLFLRFEVPAERIQYIKDGEEIDESMTIWARYNNNLHEKAKLSQHLEAWRGEDFTPQEEVDGFDLTSLLGKPCVISVKHNQNGNKTYANVDTVAKIMKGQEIPPQELPSICFGPDDTDQWEDLPKFLKNCYDARVKLEEPKEPDQKVIPMPEKPTDDFEDEDIGF